VGGRTLSFEKYSGAPGVGGLTVMVKLQLVTCPQVSEAVQVTMVVPMGKVLPLGGVQLSVGGGEHPPLAELTYVTTAPEALVAVTVILVEHTRSMGAFWTLIEPLTGSCEVSHARPTDSAGRLYDENEPR
jgi:hypothetical protein